MTEPEHQALIDRYGAEKANRMIEVLSSYKGSTGKPYQNDYMAIINWVVGRVEEEFTRRAASPNANAKPNPKAMGLDYMQRDSKVIESYDLLDDAFREICSYSG